MNQNSSFLHAIDREAIQSRADAHLQNSLPGKDIVTKTTQPLLKSTYELYVIMKSITEGHIFLSRKFSQVLRPLHHIVYIARPSATSGKSSLIVLMEI